MITKEDLAVKTPKVHYQKGEYLVSVRNPDEWHELREFINPLDPDVQQIYHQVGPDAWALYDWVCRNIQYISDDGEWWRFPGETIRGTKGDCDDSSITLCSLLLNFTDCYVVVGSYQGYGHAWVQTDGQILETTYTYAHPVADPQNYRAYAKFNDQEVIEMWPGALSNLFILARDECNKLALMGQANQDTTAPLGIAILGGIVVTAIMLGIALSKAKGVRVETEKVVSHHSAEKHAHLKPFITGEWLLERSYWDGKEWKALPDLYFRSAEEAHKAMDAFLD